MWRVSLSRDASKTLARMPRNTAETIRGKLARLARDPRAPNNMVVALRGEPGFRLRVGDYRVIYRLDDMTLVIVVIRIAPRGSAYD